MKKELIILSILILLNTMNAFALGPAAALLSNASRIMPHPGVANPNAPQISNRITDYPIDKAFEKATQNSHTRALNKARENRYHDPAYMLAKVDNGNGKFDWYHIGTYPSIKACRQNLNNFSQTQLGSDGQQLPMRTLIGVKVDDAGEIIKDSREPISCKDGCHCFSAYEPPDNLNNGSGQQ